MSNVKFSRRALIGAATAAVAVEAGMQILNSPLLGGGRGQTLTRLRRAVLDGDGRALAADAFTPAANPVFIFTVQAKWDSAGFLNRPNPLAVGIVGNPLAAASTAFPQYGLTQMFGDYLKTLNSNIGFGIVPITTTSGNHVYDGLRATMATTGCLPAFIGQSAGSLMSLHFSSVGTADASTACFAAGGTQLISYPSLDSAVSSMLNALKPLQDLPADSTTLLTSLNNYVTTNATFRQGLEDLAGRLQSAQTPLTAAQTTADATPKMTTTFDQMDPTQLTPTNPLLPQIAAAGTLFDLGLIHSTTISIANSDPNAGGNHAARGGSNVAYGPRSPNEVKSCVAQAIAQIYQRYPNALVSITSDGGRAPDGGDQENFEAFIFGPNKLINSTFVNASSRADSSTFGSTPQTVTLSDGTNAIPNQANLMSTVAKAAGLVLGETPYIPALLTTT